MVDSFTFKMVNRQQLFPLLEWVFHNEFISFSMQLNLLLAFLWWWIMFCKFQLSYIMCSAIFQIRKWTVFHRSYHFELVNDWFSSLFSFSGCCDVHGWRPEYSFCWWGINQMLPFLSCTYLLGSRTHHWHYHFWHCKLDVYIFPYSLTR